MSSIDAKVKADGWLKTPFSVGQSFPGIGADCVGFVAGLKGEDPKHWRPLVPHHACTAPRKAEQALRELLTTHGYQAIPEPVPGAIVVWKPAGGGPSHCGVVSDDIRIAWHCIQGAGVCKTAIHGLAHHRVRGFYLQILPQ